MIRRHVLRNALLPVVTMLGLDIGVALGGAIFTEAIFNLPGLGRLALNSVLNLDLPTMQGVVVFATLAIILLNLVVDLVYAVHRPEDQARVTASAEAVDARRDARRAPTARRARPPHVLQDRRRHRQGRRRRLVQRPAGGDHRRRRRVRLREERDDDVDPRPQPQAGPPGAPPGVDARRADGGVPPRVEEAHVDLDRPGAVPRREPAGGVEAAAPRAPGERDLDDLPGPDDVAQPGPERRQPARGGRAAAPRRHDAGGARARDRRAPGGRHPPRRAPDRRLSAPVLRRDAPAGDDRDGADQRARAADRGRADDGARRHDAGADPRAHPGPPGGARDGGDPHHARPRRGRRDGGRHRRDVRRARRGAGSRASRSSSSRSTRTRGGSSGRCRGSTWSSSGSRRSAASPRRSCARRRGAGSGPAVRTHSTGAGARCPLRRRRGSTPDHLDACFLDEARKLEESARVVAEIGLDAEAAA